MTLQEALETVLELAQDAITTDETATGGRGIAPQHREAMRVVREHVKWRWGAEATCSRCGGPFNGLIVHGIDGHKCGPCAYGGSR